MWNFPARSRSRAVYLCLLFLIFVDLVYVSRAAASWTRVVLARKRQFFHPEGILSRFFPGPGKDPLWVERRPGPLPRSSSLLVSRTTNRNNTGTETDPQRSRSPVDERRPVQRSVEERRARAWRACGVTAVYAYVGACVALPLWWVLSQHDQAVPGATSRALAWSFGNRDLSLRVPHGEENEHLNYSSRGRASAPAPVLPSGNEVKNVTWRPEGRSTGPKMHEQDRPLERKVARDPAKRGKIFISTAARRRRVLLEQKFRKK